MALEKVSPVLVASTLNVDIIMDKLLDVGVPCTAYKATHAQCTLFRRKSVPSVVQVVHDTINDMHLNFEGHSGSQLNEWYLLILHTAHDKSGCRFEYNEYYILWGTNA